MIKYNAIEAIQSMSISTGLAFRHNFFCLSVPQFAEFCKELQFPVEPTDDIRQLAHDFSLSFVLLQMNPEYRLSIDRLLLGENPETDAVVYDLLAGVSSDASYLVRRTAIFFNGFKILKQLDESDAIYNWITETSSFQKIENRKDYFNTDNKRDWCWRLFIWALSQDINNPLLQAHALYSDAWHDLVRTITKRKNLPPLLLDETKLTHIQAIVFDWQYKIDHVRQKIKTHEKNLGSNWEEYAFRPGGAGTGIILECIARLTTSAWQAILDELSSDEVDILQQWGFQGNTSSYDDLISFPVADS